MDFNPTNPISIFYAQDDGKSKSYTEQPQKPFKATYDPIMFYGGILLIILGIGIIIWGMITDK